MSSTEKATRCMPISLGRVRSVSIASGWMYSKSSMRPLPVWRLEHGDIGVVTVETDGGVGPVSTDRVTTEECQSEVGEEGDRRFKVAHGDADVLKFDRHALPATESWQLPRAVSRSAGLAEWRTPCCGRVRCQSIPTRALLRRSQGSAGRFSPSKANSMEQCHGPPVGYGSQSLTRTFLMGPLING